MQRRNLISIAAALAAAFAVAAPAVAQSANSKSIVDDAKASGVVGEQADGFLGFVKPTSDTALQEAVREINEGRMKLYREAAQRNGVSVEAAGAAAFVQVVQGRLKPGEYFKPNGGGWTRK